LTGWEEALILAAGMLNSSQAEKMILRVSEHNPQLAARCSLESGVDVGEVITEKVKKHLLDDLGNLRVRLPARLSAGKALAKLGDPRLLKKQSEFENAEGKKTAFIVPEWLEIPEGRFQMGTTPAQAWLLRRQKANPTQDELYPHRVFVSKFKMARYPVTVLEYRHFMDTGGYENDEYWKQNNALRWRNALLPFEESYQYQYIRTLRENKEEILKLLDVWVKQGSWSPAQADNLRDSLDSDDDSLRKRWEENEKEKRDSNGKVIQPWLWDNQRYTVNNQPVIGVSWYEACAYALWLTDILKQKQMIGWDEIIRLPTEAEWEKAARGNTGWLWTWGNLWNMRHANTLEGRVMQPSFVFALVYL
jgi:formylglycine-generating enzyme required for sulfatase activity